MTQPNLLQDLLELPAVSFQTGEVRLADARRAATRSYLDEPAENPVGGSIGPPRQAVNARVNDTGRRTAIVAPPQRRRRDQQPSVEHAEGS
jgi:hypothetical protein